MFYRDFSSEGRQYTWMLFCSCILRFILSLLAGWCKRVSLYIVLSHQCDQRPKSLNARHRHCFSSGDDSNNHVFVIRSVSSLPYNLGSPYWGYSFMVHWFSLFSEKCFTQTICKRQARHRSVFIKGRRDIDLYLLKRMSITILK